MLRLPEGDRLVSGATMLFVMLSQCGVLILFASLLTAFLGIYEGLKLERKTVLMLKDRFEYASQA